MSFWISFLCTLICISGCTPQGYSAKKKPENRTQTDTQTLDKPATYPNTILCEEVFKGNREGVMAAIKNGVALNGRCGPPENTALHVAAYWGKDAYLVEILVKADAKINIKNKYGDTPLRVALDRYNNVYEDTSRMPAHEKMIKILKQAGARE